MSAHTLLVFGRETKEGQYRTPFIPTSKERVEAHTPLIRVIRAPPSLFGSFDIRVAKDNTHTHTKGTQRRGGGYGACQYLRFKVASLALRLLKVSCRPCLKRNALKTYSQPKERKTSFLFFFSLLSDVSISPSRHNRRTNRERNKTVRNLFSPRRSPPPPLKKAHVPSSQLNLINVAS